MTRQDIIATIASERAAMAREAIRLTLAPGRPFPAFDAAQAAFEQSADCEPWAVHSPEPRASGRSLGGRVSPLSPAVEATR